MSLQVEKLEKNMVKLTVEVSAEEFDKAIQEAYLKNKSKINVPGFRKGKVPYAMVEKMYGAGIFYEDAANSLIPSAYADAVEESGLDIVSQPEIDVTQIEKGKAFIFTAEAAVKPEVTLGVYKGIEVEKKDTAVTDEEVTAELDRVRNQNARTITVEDRAVQDGDMTVIDFEGFVDGVAFQGGKGENYDLTIGSGAFIPGFEDQLVGAEIGKEVEVNVTFPEDYHAEELKGKAAVFKVTVKSIKVKELPEADDEFAQDVSDFDTLEEYKADIRAKLVERKEKEAANEKENAVIEKIIEGAQMEIPDAMVETQVRQMADNFARRLQQQGLSVEQYFQFTGLTADKLFEQMRPEALKRIQSRLVLEAVVAAENIEAAEEDVEKEFEKMASMYQMEIEKVKEFMGDKEIAEIKKDLAVQKAADFVVAEAVEK
ncbi:MAG: trigger factor [Lachnospiraceae bacterium]|nr:trigger factor [Lachnospiraceae bacterium]